MTIQPRWTAAFEDRILTNVARIRIPDFPEANAGKLREAQSVTQRAGVEREWALAHQHADPVSEINGYSDIYDGFRKHTLSALLNTTQESLPALHSLGEERGAA